MKVLYTSKYKSENTYLSDLVDELKDKVEVVTEPQNFWVSNIHYDIIHIQWPEDLCYFEEPTNISLFEIEKRINYYKQRNTKFVATLHNAIPHNKSENVKRLYELVYNNADLIINLGKYSTSLYPLQNNIVIPHHNYSKHFHVKKVSNNSKLILSFGRIRKIEEEVQIIDGFIKANIDGAKLIIVSSIVGKNPFFRKRHILKKWQYARKLKAYKNKGISFITNRLSNVEIEEYFNRANAVITPRIDNLNSGIVLMGFSFGKVVIGPSIGNLTELLEKNDNPMYIPNDIDSIAKAIKIALEREHIGGVNFKFSKEYLNISRIAYQHMEAYMDLLK